MYRERNLPATPSALLLKVFVLIVLKPYRIWSAELPRRHHCTVVVTFAEVAHLPHAMHRLVSLFTNQDPYAGRSGPPAQQKNDSIWHAPLQFSKTPIASKLTFLTGIATFPISDTTV